jgi:glycosyltransferase involved in cell wall biosynthesis
LISIITINYNDANGLKRTIESVRLQSFNDFEHIIIDGDSDDGSKEVIQEKDEWLAYAISEPDKGIYNAMNKGIVAAKGDYLLFLNSGDSLAHKNVLAVAVPKLESGKDIYYGCIQVERNGQLKKLDFPEELTFHYFFHKGYLPHPATFIKRDLFERTAMYNEDLKIAADWEFLVCAVCKYHASYENIHHLISNYDTDGISSNPKHRQLLLDEKQWILKKHFPLFLEDSKLLQAQNELLDSHRFKLLKGIESHSTARKLTTAWLKIISAIFSTKKNE